MRSRTALAALALAGSVLAATAAHAQLVGTRLTLDGFAGGGVWDGATQPELDSSPIYGARIGIRVRPWFGVEGTYGVAWTQQSGGPQIDTRLDHTGVDVQFRLLPSARVCPYLAGGWAQVEYIPDRGERQTLNGWEASAGMIWRLADRVGLRLDVRDVLDEQDADHEWLQNWMVTAGVHFELAGKLLDADADGVPDRTDRCPGTPKNVKVDASGCPIDSDRDGVPDGLDRCPETPQQARVDSHGCPIDADGDGVPDGLDRCDSTPAGAKVDAKGCPLDTDGDGVPDGLDLCASTPAGVKVDAKGCPLDTDGDGVADGLDKCPGTPAGARVDADGCPVVATERETQLLDTGLIRLQNVNFDSRKAEIKPESYAVLDEVGDILGQWPQLRIEIGGHTDSYGAADFNHKLSEQRAQAVLDYLLAEFPQLDPEQFTVKGYGESMPIASDEIRGGSAQNRRVEFKVLNREVLRKEVEKR